MKRDIFGDEHELFRAQFKRFAAAEIEPKIAGWNEKGMSDRATWKRMGDEGFLGANAPEKYGGAGADFLYDAIVMEELSYIRAHALMMSLHSDICMPYLTEFGTEAQKDKYVPGAIAGDVLLGIAMTEPSTASAGTRQSWKNNSLVSWPRRPSLSSLRPRTKPGALASTSKRLIPRCGGSDFGSVFATTMNRSPICPFEMNVFAPFST